MYEQYKPGHPLAWGIIAGIALFSAVAVGAKQGWLPVGDSRMAQACAECAVIESLRTIESPDPVAELVYGYETTVRFEDGTTSVFSYAEPPTWKAGDKVRVVDGLILAQG